MWAAGGGGVDACKLLLEVYGVNAAAASGKDGRCALHWAARNGHLDIVQRLLSAGIPVDVETHDGTVV